MSQTLLIGTYTERLSDVDGKAEGILTADFADGVVGPTRVAAAVRNPSWITISEDGRFLYSVMETAEFEGGGAVAAFARDLRTGAYDLLGIAPSAGAGPAHLEVDPSGRFLLVANYGTGSLAVLALTPDGGLGPLVDRVQHAGASVDAVRQTRPHPHQVLFDPATGHVLVPDLGMDAVLVYSLHADGHLTELRGSRIDVAARAGPRHLAFHPDAEHLFLLNELDNTLVALRRDGEGFISTDVKSTLREGDTGHNSASEVRVAASGRHVFTSNRGHDSVAVFAFDADNGTVDLKTLEPTRGQQPRDFIQTLDGSLLLVANQDSDTIVTFAFDESAPSLTFISSRTAPTPVCLRLLDAADAIG